MRDGYDRRIEYVRISLTDTCNFACPYCRPSLQTEQGNEVLSCHEWKTVLEAFSLLGVQAVRFTGGEPLLYTGLESLIAYVNERHLFDDISLTTNGSFLVERAKGLKDAGLSRLNISLDSLTEDVFKKHTGGYGSLQKVVAGLDTAIACGFANIKVNTVLWDALSKADIQEMWEFWQERSFVWRFIEYMPFGEKNGTSMSLEDIQERWKIVSGGIWEAVIEKKLGFGPAHYYRLSNDKVIGFIFPISAPYCDGCNRLRITSDGALRFCLLRNEEFSLVPFLRDGYTSTALAEIIQKAVQGKQAAHDGGNIALRRPMWRIGG